MIEINEREILIENIVRIKRNYGIELTWYEKVALKNYLKDEENGRTKFLIDTFGINELTVSYYIDGMRLIGTPEFKQYCQNHIQEWRDERELI